MLDLLGWILICFFWIRQLIIIIFHTFQFQTHKRFIRRAIKKLARKVWLCYCLWRLIGFCFHVSRRSSFRLAISWWRLCSFLWTLSFIRLHASLRNSTSQTLAIAATFIWHTISNNLLLRSNHLFLLVWFFISSNIIALLLRLLIWIILMITR